LTLLLDARAEDVEPSRRPGRERECCAITPTRCHRAFGIAGHIGLEPADGRELSTEIEAMPKKHAQLERFEETRIELSAYHRYGNPRRTRRSVRKHRAVRLRNICALQQFSGTLHVSSRQGWQSMPLAMNALRTRNVRRRQPRSVKWDRPQRVLDKKPELM